jgi:hypothetical protein
MTGYSRQRTRKPRFLMCEVADAECDGSQSGFAEKRASNFAQASMDRTPDRSGFLEKETGGEQNPRPGGEPRIAA